MADFDLAVIGGGINGVGIARDAAGRGLRVLLVEQGDLASGTSSASTKLVHGGLRYLEHGALRLVREALAEREVLVRIAPHLVRPMRFVLPVEGRRPAWLIRLGLFLYDHLAPRRILPRSESLDLSHHPCGVPLKRRHVLGFEYSDCRVDDSRLVVLNALDAAERGASIRTRTRCVRAERSELWQLVLHGRRGREAVTARALVDAAGPWVPQVADAVLRSGAAAPVRLVKGSHIVFRKLFDHDRGYLFQGDDGRIVFALPFERDFTLVGTTDQDFAGDLSAVAPGADEIRYLCRAVNDYLRQPVGPDEVVWAFAGVRSLHDDGMQKAEDVTRDYVLLLDRPSGAAPLLTVLGGKITTYRRLAEAALKELAPFVRMGPPWTRRSALPGGDFGHDDFDACVAATQRRWPFLQSDHARRLFAAYGTRIERVLGEARDRAALGPEFGADLTAAEVRYLLRHEWAETADDVLWRRSKLGLRLSAAQADALARFMLDQKQAGTRSESQRIP